MKKVRLIILRFQIKQDITKVLWNGLEILSLKIQLIEFLFCLSYQIMPNGKLYEEWRICWWFTICKTKKNKQKSDLQQALRPKLRIQNVDKPLFYYLKIW